MCHVSHPDVTSHVFQMQERSRWRSLVQQRRFKSHNRSFMHHTLGTSSLSTLLPTCLWNGRPPFLFYAFFISASKEIVSSVSVSHPLWGELYYRLCKQSVNMCCCLATHVRVESNGISIAIAMVFECVSTHMWDLCMSCDTLDIWCMSVRYVLTWHMFVCVSESVGICIYLRLYVDIWRRWVCPGGYVWFYYAFRGFAVLFALFPSTPALHQAR